MRMLNDRQDHECLHDYHNHLVITASHVTVSTCYNIVFYINIIIINIITIITETFAVHTVHSVVVPSGELHGKGRCGVFAGKTV